MGKGRRGQFPDSRFDCNLQHKVSLNYNYKIKSALLFELEEYSFKTLSLPIDRSQRIGSKARLFNRCSSIVDLRYVFRRRMELKLRSLVAVVTSRTSKTTGRDPI